MDASSKDTTDPVPLTGDRPPVGEDPDPDRTAAGEAVSSGPGDVMEVLDATRRRVDGLAGLDPAEMVGPAAEIADVLGRLIEEDDR